MTRSEMGSDKDLIRITRGEATGSHVDDLLNRQKSLRGESGIARKGRGKWYYRSWFLMMIAGTVAALLAWALLEPYFDDLLYIQGPIEEINTTEFLHTDSPSGAQHFDWDIRDQGWIRIRDEKVWLDGHLYDLSNGVSPFSIDQLEVGQEVRTYVEYVPFYDNPIAIGIFIESSPPENPPEKTRMSLSRLNRRDTVAGFFVFSLVAGFVGLALAAVDGMVCRLFRRALLAGFVGLMVGIIGGFISGLIADIVYAPISTAALKNMSGEGGFSIGTFGFALQIMGRTLAWGLAGTTMGLGQGIALRSKKLFLYGFLGGCIGGILGGLLFDPINFILLSPHHPSGHISRLVGIAMVGGCVGAMIGVVELLARDAWIRMVKGPLVGKEFLFFKDIMSIGSSPRCDIYLFNDDEVSEHHAILRSSGDIIELENCNSKNPTYVNNRQVNRVRLRHGDQIQIGQTLFAFEKRNS